MNGGYFRASKLRQAQQASELELPSIQSSNHLNHWNTRLGCPRATTCDRATTISEIVVPSIYSDQDHHQWIDRLPIYRCTVEKQPSEVERAFTRRWELPALRSRAAAACKLNNRVFRAPIQKAAPSSEFSPADLSFGVGIAAIGVFTRLHAQSRLRRNSLRASTRRHAAACVRHTRPRSWHTPRPRVASLCHCVSPYRHVSAPHQHATWQEKKKKKRKNLVRRNGAPLRSKFILKAFMASPRS
uniref:Uncharacterized protein n=1 Tax=Fagus sylvatica TaxID=28930 RepID=A0A2N9G3E6_FAGSY